MTVNPGVGLSCRAIPGCGSLLPCYTRVVFLTVVYTRVVFLTVVYTRVFLLLCYTRVFLLLGYTRVGVPFRDC